MKHLKTLHKMFSAELSLTNILITKITNLEHGVEVNDPSSDVHGVGVGNDVVGTGTTQTLGNKTIDGTSATGNNTVTIDSDNATYDNTTSGLTATNAQDAIDELDSTIDTIQASYVESFNTRTGAVVPAASDYDADQIDYDNATSGLTATDAQAAIDEVDSWFRQALQSLCKWR